MTILKESNANERPVSPLVLTHTPLLVPAIPSLLVPCFPCFNPLISWFSSLQLCILHTLLTMFHFHNINSSLNYFPPAHHLLYIPPSLLSLSLGSYPWLSCCLPKSSLLLPTSLYTSSLIFCLQPPLLLSILAFNFSQC